MDEIDASMDSVVDEFEPVDAVLLLEVGVVSSFDIIDNRLPPKDEKTIEDRRNRKQSNWRSDTIEGFRADEMDGNPSAQPYEEKRTVKEKEEEEKRKKKKQDSRLIIVDEIAKARGIDDVQSKSNTRFLDI